MPFSYWTMNFDVSPRTLREMDQMLRRDPRVIRWTMLKQGEKVEDIVEAREKTRMLWVAQTSSGIYIIVGLFFTSKVTRIPLLVSLFPTRIVIHPSPPTSYRVWRPHWTTSKCISISPSRVHNIWRPLVRSRALPPPTSPMHLLKWKDFNLHEDWFVWSRYIIYVCILSHRPENFLCPSELKMIPIATIEWQIFAFKIQWV